MCFLEITLLVSTVFFYQFSKEKMILALNCQFISKYTAVTVAQIYYSFSKALFFILLLKLIKIALIFLHSVPLIIIILSPITCEHDKKTYSAVPQNNEVWNFWPTLSYIWCEGHYYIYIINQKYLFIYGSSFH